MLAFLLFVAAALGAVPNTVAVLYFDNEGNAELEPLKVGLTQMLVTDLQGTVPDVTVVERVQLQKVLDELKLGHEGKVDPDTAGRVGGLLGARWMVMGSYFEMMGTLRIDARLVEVETGKILMSAGAADEPAAFLELEAQLAMDLREALTAAAQDKPQKSKPRPRRTNEVPQPAPVQVDKKKRPKNRALEAAKTLGEGLMFLDRREPERARESFQAAIAAEPKLHAAQDALAKLDEL